MLMSESHVISSKTKSQGNFADIDHLALLFSFHSSQEEGEQKERETLKKYITKCLRPRAMSSPPGQSPSGPSPSVPSAIWATSFLSTLQTPRKILLEIHYIKYLIFNISFNCKQLVIFSSLQ